MSLPFLRDYLDKLRLEMQMTDFYEDFDALLTACEGFLSKAPACICQSEAPVPDSFHCPRCEMDRNGLKKIREVVGRVKEFQA